MNLEQDIERFLHKPIQEASRQELYAALSAYVKEAGERRPITAGNKKLYYISAEFLTGKQLGKNLINLGVYDEIDALFAARGKSLSEVEDYEEEPSLGNGGLGRLAACFLDSAATLNMPADGIGLRYHFGLFKQDFKDHKQYEIPDRWLGATNAVAKTDIGFDVSFGRFTVHSRMYNLEVLGYNGGHNQLHLFDIDTIDESIVGDRIQFDKTDIAKNLTLFLYPDDSDEEGRKLRIYQQYFMVSNAAQYILAEQKAWNHDLHRLQDYVAIQINDTHPSMIIPELIRLLVKENISFKDACNIVSDVCAYTNHTILAEALEKWPSAYLNEVVPQLMPIIGGLDWGVICAFHDNPNLNIVDADNLVHMAHIDMHYGHSINGVAALHTEILKKQELKPFFDAYPDKFNNKTNGITFRRFLMHANPDLSRLITELIGEDWKRDAAQLENLLRYYDDDAVLERFSAVKRENKIRLASFLKDKENVDVDPDSVFDVQIKRMHEYKRQQMNALWVIYQYLRIKNGTLPATPVTVIFGGKAAPAYYQAKAIIHLILCLQELINNDPDVSPYLKVIMIHNYNVAKAEKIIPAADISEQISLASKEASGTGNMKFMLNGAVTIGTADGANVEIQNLVGAPNIYTFGKNADEVIRLYNTNAYHAVDYYNNRQSIRECIDFITDNRLLAIGDAEMLYSLKENLMHKDWFMTLLDLESYASVKESMLYDYRDRNKWKRMSLVNIAKSGFFSSDRTVAEYNRDIWHLK
ncbi:MAG: glycogen/starch/alpha-glucan phosphorylase [Bulleidia sp.]